MFSPEPGSTEKNLMLQRTVALIAILALDRVVQSDPSLLELIVYIIIIQNVWGLLVKRSS